MTWKIPAGAHLHKKKCLQVQVGHINITETKCRIICQHSTGEGEEACTCVTLPRQKKRKRKQLVPVKKLINTWKENVNLWPNKANYA